MVSVIIKQAEERERRINWIMDCLLKYPETSKEDAIMMVEMKLKCSRKNSMELIKTARWRLENEKKLV